MTEKDSEEAAAFLKSPMTRRSPPAVVTELNSSRLTNEFDSCLLCEKSDLETKISCFRCQLLFHVACVGVKVTGDPSLVKWQCVPCYNKESKDGNTGPPRRKTAIKGENLRKAAINKKSDKLKPIASSTVITPPCEDGSNNVNINKPQIIANNPQPDQFDDTLNGETNKTIMESLNEGKGQSKKSDLPSFKSTKSSKSSRRSDIDRMIIEKEMEIEMQKKQLELRALEERTRIELQELELEHEKRRQDMSDRESSRNSVISSRQSVTSSERLSRIEEWRWKQQELRRQLAEKSRLGGNEQHARGDLKNREQPQHNRLEIINQDQRPPNILKQADPILKTNKTSKFKPVHSGNMLPNTSNNHILQTQSNHNAYLRNATTQQNTHENSSGHPLLSWLNPRTTMEEFLNTTALSRDDTAPLNLSSSQLQARWVISKDLPSFSGDPRYWPLFISAYIRSTHQCGFTDDENCARLSKCLKGDAYERVKTHLMMPTGLQTALRTLKQLYGRPNLIFNSAVEHVLNTPVIKIEQMETLITFSSRLEQLCVTVRAAQMDAYLNSPALLSELVNKLPATLKLEWSRYQAGIELEEPMITLGHFSDWLIELSIAASRVASEPICKQSQEKATPIKRNRRPNETHRLAIHDTIDDKVCSYCTQTGHVVAECPDFCKLSTNMRWKEIHEKKHCIGCLEKHYLNKCKNRKKCEIDGCERPHHKLLHTPKTISKPSVATKITRENKKTTNEPVPSTSSSSTNPITPQINTHVGLQSRPHLQQYQIVPVNLSDGKGLNIMTYAFLDAGSNTTLLDNDVAKKLKLSGHSQPITLKWTSEMKRCEPDSKKVTLFIRGNDEDCQEFKLTNVRTVTELKLPQQSLRSDQLQNYKHLKGLAITSYCDAIPHILIGLDNFQLLTQLEVIEGEWNEPTAARTRLGWAIFGCYNNTKFSEENRISVHEVNDDQNLHTLVKGFFNFESLGIRAPTNEVETKEETRARHILDQTVRLTDDGHYEAGLLWRTDEIKLPHSRAMATQRFHCFERKLYKNPETATEVRRQIHDYIAKGYLIELNKFEAKIQRDKTWYLPIFAVTNPNKPGKVRLVWDAAATVDNQSLNNHLLPGPDMLENLVGVLSRFREHRVAIGGDLEQMFHQVKIRADDQDSQRCLWRDSPQQPIKTYKMSVMTFGSASSPATAHYVKNRNADRFKNEFPRAVEAIKHRHYVDDFIDSFATEEECLAVTFAVVDIHRQGGFHLRNFVSNSKLVLNELPGNESTVATTKLLVSDEAKILGMHWDMQKDILFFKVDEKRIGTDLLRHNSTPTKRIVLRTVMLIFDPLGHLSFYIVRGKILLKEIWRFGIGWDDELKIPELEMWKVWIGDLRKIENIQVQRWYFTNQCDEDEHELHTFVDASENAAAAVVYILKVSVNQKEVAFVTSKTKVAPNRPISIPRMELQAAVLGARLANSVVLNHSIHISRTIYWSDSRNVLCWVRSPRRFKVFVAHRIGEIRETTDVQNWRWVPSHLNVADVATKWNATSKKLEPAKWLKGPEFLWGGEQQWPQEMLDENALNDNELETRCNFTTTVFHDDLRPDVSRFSSFSKLVRVQAYVLRFFQKRCTKAALTSQEIKDAEIYLLRSVQKEAFPEEFTAFEQQKLIHQSSKIRAYSPFLGKDQILRMNSRLSNAEYLSYDQRFPIILPSNHHVVDLLIDQEHRKFLHQNHSTVLNELRQHYAIPSLRAKVKSVRAKCGKCRITSAKVEVPEMSALPISRLAARMRPFFNTGLDFFGPMLVKIGRRNEKRWGALFTCLTVRAIHIELVSSLSTDSCLLAVRSFICRRGQPGTIYSDRGTNFRGADHELQDMMNENMQRKLEDSYQKIRWVFNPPSTPHMGGAWERLVRSVKTSLRASITDRTPTEEALRSALTEVEAIINSRPLTYVDLNNESLESLTPNHFLLGSSSGIKPIGDFSDDPGVLRKAWKQQQHVTAIFWKRWTAEYLPEISKRTKWFDPVFPIQEGDVVAIIDPDIPHSWQLGRVEKAIRSEDGTVRKVEVRTAQGLYLRPAAKLAILVRNEPANITDTEEKLRDNGVSSARGNVADGNIFSHN